MICMMYDVRVAGWTFYDCDWCPTQWPAAFASETEVISGLETETQHIFLAAMDVDMQE